MSRARSLSIVLLVWAIASTLAASYFYYKFTTYREVLEGLKGKLIQVSLLIDYGNGTKVWHNNTLTFLGSSLFNLTSDLSTVSYSTGEYGVFVDSIGGLPNDPNASKYWIFWIWDPEKGEWTVGEVSSDRQMLVDRGVYAWKYCDTSKWPPEPP